MTPKFCQKCDKGGEKKSTFWGHILLNDVQTLRINLRPVQVRYGHHDIVPGLTILILFAAHVLELEDASLHCFVAAKSSPLFYTGHTSLCV